MRRRMRMRGRRRKGGRGGKERKT
jgi:hypothetical protein